MDRSVLRLVGLTLAIILVVMGMMAFDLGLARADERSRSVVECEAGAEVIQLAEGRIRVIGYCSGVVRDDEGPTRPDGEPETGPNYEYPYPVPEVYPDPGNDACNVPWIWGESCP